MLQFYRLALLLSLLIAPLQPAFAQTVSDDAAADPATVIDATPDQKSDEQIQERIASIFLQISSLAEVNVTVKEGVVTLEGRVSNEAQAKRALELANRLEGVVTVVDSIERTLDVQGNVAPVIDQFESDLNRSLKALPLILLSLLVFFVIAYVGHRLAKWPTPWRKLAPNPFLAELIAQAVRVAAIIGGLVVALNLMGATTLMGTILGGAGVLGLAIGFAVRDSMENYISSIMLSLRQPFRANDHVVIDDHEGKVMRLTSRATILMTLDGNHLRIPNSMVFKAVILNYTTNPERRFEFLLGVDAEDDPIAAMKTGLDAMRKLEFVLADPNPSAVVETVGDSNIVIKFMAWVNQQQTDFGKARSLAIRTAKNVLEEQGFTLPEPIYRLRFDKPMTEGPEQQELTITEGAVSDEDDNTKVIPKPANVAADDEILDVSPDTRLEEKVNEERAQEGEADLLDHSRPTE